MIRAVDLMRDGGAQLVAGDPETEFSGGAIDTRLLEPGEVFFALAGTRTDGHRFLEDAWRRGARGAVVRHRVDPVPPGKVLLVADDVADCLRRAAQAHRMRAGVTVVGVTGSVGKTTTKELLATVLEELGPVLKTPGNYNTDLGLPLALLRLQPGHHRVAVVEMGMRGKGEIAALCRIARPDVGLVTGVGESHSALLGSLQAVAEAKSELLQGLPPEGVAVVPGWDRWRALLVAASRARRVLVAGEDLRAEEVTSLGLEGTRFLLCRAEERVPVTLRLPGRHHVPLAVLTATAGVALGLPLARVAAALERVPADMARIRPQRLGRLLVLEDAYNASPTSMRAALELLREVAVGHRAVAVLGDMREILDAPEQHRQLGREAARVADLILAVGEHAGDVCAGAEEAQGCCRAFPHVEAVAAELERWLQPGDVVLVKGSRALALERLVGHLSAHPLGQGTPGAEGGASLAGRAGQGDREP